MGQEESTKVTRDIRILFRSESGTFRWYIQPDVIIHELEGDGRVCYRSENKAVHGGGGAGFLQRIIANGHESVLEHINLTASITCSRACSHQIVRHRLCAFSQESQRYVNYEKKGYEIIVPECIRNLDTENKVGGMGFWKWQPWVFDSTQGNPVIENDMAGEFYQGCITALHHYQNLLGMGCKPEDARFLLPNAMSTRLRMSANIRQWRHIFRERALNSHAQWEIKNVMGQILDQAVRALPCLFEDLVEKKRVYSCE